MTNDRRYNVLDNVLLSEGTLVNVPEGATWGVYQLTATHYSGQGRIVRGPDYDGDYLVAATGDDEGTYYVGYEHLEAVEEGDEGNEPEQDGEKWGLGQVIPHSGTPDPLVSNVLVSDRDRNMWKWDMEGRVWRSTSAALRRSTRELIQDYGTLKVESHPHHTDDTDNKDERELGVKEDPEPVLPSRDTLDHTRRIMHAVTEIFPQFRAESMIKVLDLVERIKDIEEGRESHHPHSHHA